jgi:transcriptional regulator with XRE-family HTH domain
MAEENELPREGLRKARENRGLSQDGLAKLVGVATKEVRRWEQGKADPYRYHRPKLAEHLGITPEELEALLANTQEPPLQTQNQERQPPRRWMMPYQRNPYFIGRDGMLDDLYSAFFSEDRGILTQALTGQPGIGKTQIAIEYAYRYSEKYQAILWVTAETTDALISDFVRIASILQLPEKDDPAKQRVVDGVKLWLNSNRDWLLVLDNVADPNLVDAFLPQEGQGHILLTARDQEVGTRATTFVVKKMEKRRWGDTLASSLKNHPGARTTQPGLRAR